MKNEKTKVIVRFNEQQIYLLNMLKKEGKFGDAYGDIILNVFREYIKQNFFLIDLKPRRC